MRKTLLLTAAIALIALPSCHHFGIKGNGHVTTEDRTVSPFTKITVEGVFPVELSQTGGPESVKVETDENLQSTVVVKTDGDELIIKSAKEESISRSTKMKVYINIKKVSDIDFKSVGALTSTNTLKLDSVNLRSESVGKLNLAIDAQYLHADLESVGSTELSGNVYEARINNKSVGALSAFDLKTKVMMIHSTSVGVTEVYADSAFYIRSAAIGALFYKGGGDVKELKSEGIGRVQKKD
jgi:hypothetical protein